MINKRGQMGLFLLPFITILLIGITLFAFAISDRNFGSKSLENYILVNNLEFRYDYVLSEAKIIAGKSIEENGTKEDFMTTADLRDLKSNSVGNFYGKIRNEDFVFVSEGGEYKLEIKDLFVKSEVGESKLTRGFDICFVFRDDGSYKGECEIKQTL